MELFDLSVHFNPYLRMQILRYEQVHSCAPSLMQHLGGSSGRLVDGSGFYRRSIAREDEARKGTV